MTDRKHDATRASFGVGISTYDDVCIDPIFDMSVEAQAMIVREDERLDTRRRRFNALIAHTGTNLGDGDEDEEEGTHEEEDGW